ncbi:MAG TPA: chitobiase/beta-hexosaminidase C-terminal domain-containing protein [Candidatus Diapherotrites archaeon]|nr:chitobiase/beta-hexosaminidase C-terminal domain-containing protein [Candidatus Diapherotrites archaeon]
MKKNNKKKEKTESIEDIFDHLKIIVKGTGSDPKPVEKPKKSKPSDGVKLGIILLICILLLGVVVGGYFLYKANSKITEPTFNDDDQNQSNFIEEPPIYEPNSNSGNSNYQPNPYSDPNTNNDENKTTIRSGGSSGGGGSGSSGGGSSDPCKNLGTVSFNPNPGIYNQTINVALNYSKPNCDFSIHYTLDGTIPTQSSPKYSSPITISQSKTIKAIIYAKNRRGTTINGDVATGLYVINSESSCVTGVKKVNIEFDPDEGTYSQKYITINLDYPKTYKDCDYKIVFTTDGTTPKPETSQTYTTPFKIMGDTTIKAAVYTKNLNNQYVIGNVSTKQYKVGITPVNTCATNIENVNVLFAPDEGTYNQNYIMLKLDYPETYKYCNYNIAYTTNGNTPHPMTSQTYTTPIKIMGNTTVKAVVYTKNVNDQYVTGNVSTKQYKVGITPVNTCATNIENVNVLFAPDEGTYNQNYIMLKLDYPETYKYCNYNIAYTTNGNTPHPMTSQTYTTPIKIMGNTTVKAVVYTKNVNDQYVTGNVSTKQYKVGATPVNYCANIQNVNVLFTPDEGTYNQNYIMLNLDYPEEYKECGYNIAYTTNGNTPHPMMSQTYTATAPVFFKIMGNTTVKAVVYTKNANDQYVTGNVSTKQYKVGATPVNTCANNINDYEIVFNPPAGNYPNVTKLIVYLVNSYEGDCDFHIYYTLNGTDPSPYNSDTYLYNTHIGLISNTTIKAALFGYNSSTKSYYKGPTFTKRYTFFPQTNS